ncbi:methyltransferase [Desulfoglaeba alkanexedens ALDC]|jgi:predicted nicotinamide N-methyase|uniref:Methyltransferase n=1 Tax=Desulfoglaeba alkanexedens ALDC TaxID=980445 RepID=A0A4P8L2B3_9BACT|nr:methyltransferase [Desulfoglaeba alkanexedens ALDC]
MMTKEFKVSQQELDRLIGQIRQRFDVEMVPLRIGEETLQILHLANLEEIFLGLLDAESPTVSDLPFWAKVWDSSFVLAYFIGTQPVLPGRKILEIGAGLGVVGVYAARRGHRVLITDVNDDALLFARANVLANRCLNAEVMKLDWSSPELDTRFDTIIGSEVVYDRESYPLLVDFLRRALSPDGTAFIAKHGDLQAPRFFSELTRFFKFKERRVPITSSDGCQEVCLYAIRHKEPAAVGAA